MNLTTDPGGGNAAPQASSPATSAPAARAIAFYLPQFHPTPENDAWWGVGFTEWTNTARARPLYRGHQQPRIPADLGFYDLRLAETRAEQAALARRYGVEAFCYWHYWFGAGRRMLNRPFDEVLATGEPDHRFCLGWANQSWTGVWHGASDRILMEQTYPGDEDERAHFEYLLAAFTDRRYLTVEGRPVFYVFRPEELPDPAGFVRRWRTMARANGLPGLHLLAEISDLKGHGPTYLDAVRDGFDAGVYVRLPCVVDRRTDLRMRLARRFLHHPERYPHAAHLLAPPHSIRDHALSAVYPNWDNTPRSGRRGLSVERSSPQIFQTHVEEAAARLAHLPTEQRLLFVKSWNEWAEGNYLEPDVRSGHQNLAALARGLRLPR